jgi:hypothetical protein
MNYAERKRGPARLQLLLIAALFLGPLIFAAWMYYSGNVLQPAARSNYGTLLEPIRNLAGAYPEVRELAAGKWLLVYANSDDCSGSCPDALYTMRQSRLMLGNDMNRLVRVFLHGETPPDTVLSGAQLDGLVLRHNAHLAEQLWSALPQGVPHGGILLIDPLGNLVMYFRSDLSPHHMVDDIEHLLDLSHIG